MFGFAVNSDDIDLDQDETYIKMSVTQYNLLNGSKLSIQLLILDKNNYLVFYWF